MNDPLNLKATTQNTSKPAPGVHWAQSDSPSLKKTRLGLSLIFFGNLIMIICMMGLLLSITLLVGIKWSDNRGAQIIISTVGLVGATLLCVVAPIYCLAVPDESDARGFLAGSLVFYIVSMLISIINIIISQLNPLSFMIVIYSLFSLIGFIMFMLFMKKLSEYIDREDLAAYGKKILIGSVICSLMWYVSMCSPQTWLLLWFMAGLGKLVFFIMYMNLLNSLRKALGKAGDRVNS